MRDIDMPSQGITQSRTGLVKTLPASPPAQPAAPPLPGPRPLLPALLSGGLLWLCYFPAACGWLAWVALVPFLCLVRLPRRFRYLAAFAGGLVFYWPALQWMRVADPRMYVTWGGLATYCAAYFPLALFLVRLCERHTPLPLVVSVPVVWTALEFLRATFGTGFAWYFLGHSQHEALPLIQVSDLAGAYAVSFVVAAVNALLFEVLWGRQWFRAWLAGPAAPPRWGKRALLVQALAVVGLLFATLGYGYWRLGQDAFARGPRVALVQGNVDQRIRNEASVVPASAAEMVRHYIDLSDVARTFGPNLIAWPETSSPEDWTEVAPGEPSPASQEMARRVADRWHTHILLGLNAQVGVEPGPSRRYNSALLITPDGKPAGRYDKIHRVPFGEYVPLRDVLPVMNQLAPYDFDYSVWPGTEFTRFELPAPAGRTSTFGVLVCYEDTDAEVARPYAGGDGRPAADFLINVSNDGWFNGTSEHDEHLAVCRFRAVECRRAVARSVNMGISAVIDGNGRVLAPHPLPPPEGAHPRGVRVWAASADPGAPGLPPRRWKEFKKVPGVLLADVPLDDRVSLYARWGDWLPWACWFLVGAAVLGALGKRWRRVAAPVHAAG
jgi:apolipoprotein N-acyltransferase